MSNAGNPRDAARPDEERIKNRYGVPSAVRRFQMGSQRKQFFDSGDFALNKAGKNNDIDTAVVGREHPTPENIRHLTSPANTAAQGLGASILAPGAHHGSISAGSPVKESSSLHRETSADEIDAATAAPDAIPIRQGS